MKPLLTIGMSVYDDYDGLFFTVQSLRMHHDTANVEFVVVDNNPDSVQGKLCEQFITESVKGKYIRFTDLQTSFSKYTALQYATGEYYLGIDCHVLLNPSFITRLFAYFEKNHDCKDIIQGPLIYDDLLHTSTHFRPEWRGGMYGIWDIDTESLNRGEPFIIPMTGMGMFACKTSNFPSINTNFRGFGGEEWYVQEKFRRQGGKCVCIPELKWMHRFNRPHGIPYNNRWEDRIWNYYLGWWELYPDPNHPMILSIEDHFINYVSKDTIDTIFEDVINL